MTPFKTEQDAIAWIQHNIPFAVRTVSKRAKTMLVNPFSSGHAFKEITEHLGKELFKLMNNGNNLHQS